MPKLNPRVRKEMILVAALKLASKRGGWSKLHRGLIAAEAGCSRGLVNRYFADMDTLRGELVQDAVKERNYMLLGQAIVDDHPAARFIPSELKVASVRVFAKGA